jgi:hypothetical protein
LEIKFKSGLSRLYDWLVVEQALIYRTEFLNIERSVINPLLKTISLEHRKVSYSTKEIMVVELRLDQIGDRSILVEKVSIERWDAKRVGIDAILEKRKRL